MPHAESADPRRRITRVAARPRQAAPTRNSTQTMRIESQRVGRSACFGVRRNTPCRLTNSRMQAKAKATTHVKPSRTTSASVASLHEHFTRNRNAHRKRITANRMNNGGMRITAPASGWFCCDRPRTSAPEPSRSTAVKARRLWLRFRRAQRAANPVSPYFCVSKKNGCRVCV